MSSFRVALLALCLALIPIGPLVAQQEPPKQTAEDAAEAPPKKDRASEVNEELQVLGSREKARTTPGSAHYISKQDLEQQEHTDIHRILRRVPGVYIQEEDGLGLRPNIGFRGTGVERSQKITLMEDGVLIAPAPYTAPAAYYFPSVGRMETLEVLKGPATVTQGPYTNGGALNMVSTSIPGDFGGQVTLSGGSHDTGRIQAAVGDGNERLGWLVETFNIDSNGFKELDGGGDTGTRVNDYMAKLRFSPATDRYQFFELKLGKTKQDGHETYLGLTEADFRLNPVRRYAGSQMDTFASDHEQLQLRHYIQLSDALTVRTVVYYNDFFRNWHKAERTLGVGNAAILADPDAHADALAVLRGEVDSEDDALFLRNNRRNYFSKGIQTTLALHGATGRLTHEFEASIRYHEDEEDRLQEDEGYRITGGRMIQTSAESLGTRSNQVSGAEALSAYLSDTIAFGKWTFRPGLRFETIDYQRTRYAGDDPNRVEEPTNIRENSVDVVLPGLGVDYGINRDWRVFTGIYRGFSPPGAGQNEETREERSTNMEGGFRYAKGKLSAEVIGFFNDYDNLLGVETVSGGGGGAGELFNGGAVEVKGVEATMTADLFSGEGFSMPFSVGYTYNSSSFKSSFESSFADWSPRVEKGDELPYIPTHQLYVNLGWVVDRYSLNLGADFTDEMRTSAGQGPIPAGEGTDARWVFDLAGDVRFGKKYKVFAQIRNLTDEVYIVSRRPYGLRPGLTRTLLVGAKARF